MKEVEERFKVDLEELLDNMYQKFEELIDGAMFDMSFFGTDCDEQFLRLQEIMIEVLQDRFAFAMFNDEESE